LALNSSQSAEAALVTWFPDELPTDHLCLGLKCGHEQADFLCCLNRGFDSGVDESNTTTPDPHYFTPARVPSDGSCKLPTGWPNWVVPVIVLGGIVFVVLVIVLIYVVINRPESGDTYEPINK